MKKLKVYDRDHPHVGTLRILIPKPSKFWLWIYDIYIEPFKQAWERRYWTKTAAQLINNYNARPLFTIELYSVEKKKTKLVYIVLYKYQTKHKKLTYQYIYKCSLSLFSSNTHSQKTVLFRHSRYITINQASTNNYLILFLSPRHTSNDHTPCHQTYTFTIAHFTRPWWR